MSKRSKRSNPFIADHKRERAYALSRSTFPKAQGLNQFCFFGAYASEKHLSPLVFLKNW